MQKCRRATIALITLAALLAAASPAAAETPFEKADALFDGLIQTNGAGLAVLVAQNGKILFEKSYGLADREHDVPVTPQTTFRIASVTKQFTAAAILKLQEEGKVSVDDKLSKYIPDFPRGNEVTLRQLLTHTSGIHDYINDPGFNSRATNATATESLIEETKKYPYDFDPGTKWHYDNAGYVLLGCIIEKVSGQSYGEFLRENFFEPLGMTNTGVYRARLGLPHEALGYGLSTNGFKPALGCDSSWLLGCGALYSSVEDLYCWNEGILNGRVLDATSLRAAFAPVKMFENQVDSDAGYGFGWNIDRYRGLWEIYHAGDIPGFRSMLLLLPDEKFTVVVLANANPDSFNPFNLVDQLKNIFLAGKFGPMPIVNANVTPESYDALTGRYDLDGRIVTISRSGTHLFAQFSGGQKDEIFPRSATEFFWKGSYGYIAFVKDSSGKVIRLIVCYGTGFDLAALRAKDIDPSKSNDH